MSSLDLVTGGAGFVGRHLVDALLREGRQVRVLDLRSPSGLSAPVDYIQGSILDRDVVAAAVAGCDRVFHLAANPNLWHRDPSSFLSVNTYGTDIVLGACAASGTRRVVYCSTESILKSYRWRTAPPTVSGLIDETIPLTLTDMPGPYCRSKFLAEQRALDWAQRGLPVVIVNPTLPVGPGDHLGTPPTRMLLDFVNGKTPAFLESTFNLIDVRDVAKAHIVAAEKGRVGQRYILGAHNRTLSALLGSLEKISGRPMPRRRIPYWLAYGAAVVSEGLAAVTKKPPMAPLTGVRLARTPMQFDSAKAIRELGLEQTPLEKSLTDFLIDHHARGNITVPLSLPVSQQD